MVPESAPLMGDKPSASRRNLLAASLALGFLAICAVVSTSSKATHPGELLQMEGLRRQGMLMVPHALMLARASQWNIDSGMGYSRQVFERIYMCFITYAQKTCVYVCVCVCVCVCLSVWVNCVCELCLYACFAACMLGACTYSYAKQGMTVSFVL
jgi:hypothetical protein